MAIERGTPSVLRAMNERTVLTAIDETGAISRAELARQTGLSKPTVSLALSRLHSAGLVREVGRTNGGRGATALLYDLEPKAALVLGLDVGRRWVRAAIADVTGEVVVQRRERSDLRSGRALMTQVIEMGIAVAAEIGCSTAELSRAVLGSPGVVDPETDRVRLASNLPGWHRPGLLSDIRAALDTRLLMENDVNLSAISELAHGHGRDEPTFVFLHLGSGVGMALMLDGKLYRGSTGLAGEIGYRPGGAFDAVSADAVVRAARTAGLMVRGAEDLAAAARDDNERAVAIFDEEARRLAAGLAVVASVLDPPLIVFGGGFGAGAADLLLDRVAAELRTLSPSRPRLAASALGDAAVLDGALVSGLDAAKSELFALGSSQSDSAAAEVETGS
jgi:predicted NBD/HSP70 family sugar kinase